MSSSPDWPDALLAPFPPKTPSLTYSKPIVTYSHTDPVLAPQPPPSVRGQFGVQGSCQRLLREQGSLLRGRLLREQGSIKLLHLGSLKLLQLGSGTTSSGV